MKYRGLIFISWKWHARKVLQISLPSLVRLIFYKLKLWSYNRIPLCPDTPLTLMGFCEADPFQGWCLKYWNFHNSFLLVWNAALYGLWWTAEGSLTPQLKGSTHYNLCPHKQTICKTGKKYFGALPSAILKFCPIYKSKGLILHVPAGETVANSSISVAMLFYYYRSSAMRFCSFTVSRKI